MFICRCICVYRDVCIRVCVYVEMYTDTQTYIKKKNLEVRKFLAYARTGHVLNIVNP